MNRLQLYDNNEPKVTLSVLHPIQLTAILDLIDCLLTEQYEQCGDIISVAKEFGATGEGVAQIIRDVLSVRDELTLKALILEYPDELEVKERS